MLGKGPGFITGITTSSSNGIVASGNFCTEDSHRDDTSMMCSTCLSGYNSWNHVCLECDGFNWEVVWEHIALAMVQMLVIHTLSQSTASAALNTVLFTGQSLSLIVCCVSFAFEPSSSLESLIVTHAYVCPRLFSPRSLLSSLSFFLSLSCRPFDVVLHCR